MSLLIASSRRRIRPEMWTISTTFATQHSASRMPTPPFFSLLPSRRTGSCSPHSKTCQTRDTTGWRSLRASSMTASTSPAWNSISCSSHHVNLRSEVFTGPTYRPNCLPNFVPVQKLCVNIYIYMLFYMSSVFFGLPIVSCSLMIIV